MTTNKTNPFASITAPSFGSGRPAFQGRPSASAPRGSANPNVRFENLTAPVRCIYVGVQTKLDGTVIASKTGNVKVRFAHTPLRLVKMGNQPEKWVPQATVYTDMWVGANDLDGVFPGQQMEITAGGVKHDLYEQLDENGNVVRSFPQRVYVQVTSCIPVGKIITEKAYQATQAKKLKAKARAAKGLAPIAKKAPKAKTEIVAEVPAIVSTEAIPV